VRLIGSVLCGHRFFVGLTSSAKFVLEIEDEYFGFVELGIYSLKCLILLSYDSRSVNHYI
jgi:hypothetical protein